MIAKSHPSPHRCSEEPVAILAHANGTVVRIHAMSIRRAAVAHDATTTSAVVPTIKLQRPRNHTETRFPPASLTIVKCSSHSMHAGTLSSFVHSSLVGTLSGSSYGRAPSALRFACEYGDTVTESKSDDVVEVKFDMKARRSIDVVDVGLVRKVYDDARRSGGVAEGESVRDGGRVLGTTE